MNNVSGLNLSKQLNSGLINVGQPQAPVIAVKPDRFEPSFEGGKSKIAAGIGAFAVLLSLLGLAGCSKEPEKPKKTTLEYSDPVKLNAQRTDELLKALDEIIGNDIKISDFDTALTKLQETKLKNLTENFKNASEELDKKQVLLDFLIKEGIDSDSATKIVDRAVPKIIKNQKDDDIDDVLLVLGFAVLLTGMTGLAGFTRSRS